MLSNNELVQMSKMNKNTIMGIFDDVIGEVTDSTSFFQDGYDYFINSLEHDGLRFYDFDGSSKEYSAGFKQGASHINGIIRWERDREIEAVSSKYRDLTKNLDKIIEDLI